MDEVEHGQREARMDKGDVDVERVVVIGKSYVAGIV